MTPDNIVNHSRPASFAYILQNVTSKAELTPDIAILLNNKVFNSFRQNMRISRNSIEGGDWVFSYLAIASAVTSAVWWRLVIGRRRLRGKLRHFIAREWTLMHLSLSDYVIACTLVNIV